MLPLETQTHVMCTNRTAKFPISSPEASNGRIIGKTPSIRPFRKVAMAAFACVLSLPLTAQDGPQAPTPRTQPTLKQLLVLLERSESTTKTIQLEMTSEGAYPGGAPFRTKGKIRVLRSTLDDARPSHAHVTMRAEFGEDLVAETESVRTPEGVYMREVHPAFGEVFLRIDKALAVELDEASKILGQDVPGSLGAQGSAPLGSSLLQQLSTQFDLEVSAQQVRGGQSGYWVRGDLKKGAKAEAELGAPLPDRVELFVRAGDGVVLEMIHLAGGEPVMSMKITKVILGAPIDPKSFAIDAAASEVVDFSKHPPAAAQLEQIRADVAKAKAKRSGSGEQKPAVDGSAGDGSAGDGR